MEVYLKSLRSVTFEAVKGKLDNVSFGGHTGEFVFVTRYFVISLKCLPVCCVPFLFKIDASFHSLVS